MRAKSRVPRWSSRRRSHRSSEPGKVSQSDGPFFPTRIPGVRIAYVGRQSDVATEMQAYWQSRGATFVHLPLDGRGEAKSLKSMLIGADVVFHSAEDVTLEILRELRAFCERAEKPLIMLDENTLSGLTEALRAWCPIA